MKNKLTVLLLLFVSIGYSQASKEQLANQKSNSTQKETTSKSDCADFFLEYSNTEGRDDYEVLFKTPNNSITITIVRSKSLTAVEKIIVFKTQASHCDNLTGIQIKLSNKETLNIQEGKSACKALHGGDYLLTYSLPLSDEVYAKLSKWNITKYSIGKTTVPADFEYPDEFRTLIKCIFEGKK